MKVGRAGWLDCVENVWFLGASCWWCRMYVLYFTQLSFHWVICFILLVFLWTIAVCVYSCVYVLKTSERSTIWWPASSWFILTFRTVFIRSFPAYSCVNIGTRAHFLISFSLHIPPKSNTLQILHFLCNIRFYFLIPVYTSVTLLSKTNPHSPAQITYSRTPHKQQKTYLTKALNIQHHKRY